MEITVNNLRRKHRKAITDALASITDVLFVDESKYNKLQESSSFEVDIRMVKGDWKNVGEYIREATSRNK